MLSRRLGAHQRPNCSFLFALTAPSSIIFCSRSVSLVTKSLFSFSLVITWWRLAGRRGGTRKEGRRRSSGRASDKGRRGRGDWFLHVRALGKRP